MYGKRRCLWGSVTTIGFTYLVPQDRSNLDCWCIYKAAIIEFGKFGGSLCKRISSEDKRIGCLQLKTGANTYFLGSRIPRIGDLFSELLYGLNGGCRRGIKLGVRIEQLHVIWEKSVVFISLVNKAASTVHTSNTVKTQIIIRQCSLTSYTFL